MSASVTADDSAAPALRHSTADAAIPSSIAGTLEGCLVPWAHAAEGGIAAPRSPSVRLRRAGGGGKAEAPPPTPVCTEPSVAAGREHRQRRSPPGPHHRAHPADRGFRRENGQTQGEPRGVPARARACRPGPAIAAAPGASGAVARPGCAALREGIWCPPRGHRRQCKSESLTNSAGSCRIRPPPQRGRDTTAARSPLRGRREQGWIALEG